MKDGSKLAQKLPQLSTLVKKLVPYVIRENVPLAYFTFSYKKISTTHLALLTQCR